MIRNLFITVLCSLTSCIVIGQEEATIDEVVIQAKNTKDNSLQLSLSNKQIENKLANDLGQIMNLFPGIQVKNYGDVGGLKTVSFRSLGAGHTALSLDYSSVSTTQSGQADLSNIPVDFIQSIELIALSPTRVDIPIHAKLSGVVIQAESVHSYSHEQTKNVILGVQAGSFDHYEGYGLFHYQTKSVFSTTLSGKYRSYGGRFPFSYRNGTIVSNERRKNNGLKEYFGTWSIQLKPNKHHIIQARFSANNYEKQLAGAVVFYNSNSQQFLNGYGYIASINHRFFKKKWNVFSSANFQQNTLQYLDSAYLNSQGYLDNRFLASQLDFQTQAAYSISENSSLLVGTSYTSEQLSGKNLTKNPYRNSFENVLGYQLLFLKKMNLLFQFGGQGIFEKRDTILKQKWNMSPALALTYNINKKHSISLSSRYINRQPTFSELYYQQIGNIKLRTEKATLASIQYNFTQPFKSGYNQFIVQPFYTYIQDKILAIPTKNLFIWSIQNIGISDALGVELVDVFQKKWGNSTVGVRLNYTFQIARDLSDPTSSTYKDILSYSPLNTGTIEVNYAWKQLSFFVLNSYLGERYAMNQNIPSNLLEAYNLINVGAGYQLSLKRNELSLKATVNNITNKQYYYINYFVMPGINFNIRLQYAF